MKLKFVLALGVIVWMAACGPTTELTKSWTDPSVDSSTFKSLKKILVIAKMRDEATSRVAEDKIVASLRSAQGVQSYSYLSVADTSDKEINSRLKKDGFEGLIVMKLSSIDKTLNVETDYYGTYYGYGYRYGYGYPYGTPGTTTVDVDETFNVESRIYSLETGKLLWTGMTATYDPSSLNASLDEIINAIRDHLVSKGLIEEK